MAKICILGLWHLGCVSAACLSKSHHVVGWDPDGKTVSDLQSGKLPISEPGLPEAISLVQKQGRLEFSSDLSAAAAGADFIFFTFDIPVDGNDKSDLSPLWKTLDLLMPSIRDGQVIVVSSQVPVGTCRKMQEAIRSAKKSAGVCYTPENLRLGSAISCFLSPERIVIGVSEQPLALKMEEFFKGIGGERVVMGLESAEMAKHAMNAYLATLISFSGEISDLCEKTGADAGQVMRALLLERRVSPNAPLMPGLGFGGGTLARDVQTLRTIGAEKSVPTRVLDAAFESNRERTLYVQRRLSGAIDGVRGRKIAFFGLTYKPGTDTLRRSLALDIIRGLVSSGAEVSAYDPAISSQVEGYGGLQVCKSALECAKGADALVITTAWDEFRTLDYAAICAAMRKPIIIDARNMLDRSALPQSAEYFGVGIGDDRRI
ncbi:MAG: nucleotide sugar dehydrogenase [Candidatus Micrarchaeia archaeon]